MQARRVNRWRNESSYLTPLTAAQGLRGHFRASLAATLVGIDAPPASRLFEAKPYVIGDLTTSTVTAEPVANELGAAGGLDVKLGVTQGVTADFTVNPDFAQVEVDEQQINLTRFNLFFPEKREFFLENQGIFGFGGVATAGRFAGISDTPVLFYSRRIGLTQDFRSVPLRAGGRVTGRAGAFTFGALNIRAGDAPQALDGPGGDAGARATSFTVLRARRDLLRRSSVGAMFTGRSVSIDGRGQNTAYGVDGAFGFFDDLTINTHWAQTRSEGRTGNETSYRGHLDYAGDRYGVQLEHLLVGDAFNPEVGFVRRRDMRRSFAEFRFSPRPRAIDWVRRFVGTGSFAYVENLAGQVETRETLASFAIELDNSDVFTVGGLRSYEFLPRAFPISREVTLPVGGYDFATVNASYDFGQQRPWSANVLAEHGTFYSGHKTGLTISRGRASVTNQLSVEPMWSINWIDLAEGAFTTNLVGTRGDLHDDAADVHERPSAVQLEPRRGVGQRPLPLGIPAGERAVRRLQRGPRHDGAPLSGPPEPGLRRQVQSPLPLLRGERSSGGGDSAVGVGLPLAHLPGGHRGNRPMGAASVPRPPRRRSGRRSRRRRRPTPAAPRARRNRPARGRRGLGSACG